MTRQRLLKGKSGPRLEKTWRNISESYETSVSQIGFKKNIPAETTKRQVSESFFLVWNTGADDVNSMIPCRVKDVVLW